MTLPALLYTTASAIGLWAVAAGLLTHHPIVSVIGAGVAVCGAGLGFVEAGKQPRRSDR